MHALALPVGVTAEVASTECSEIAGGAPRLDHRLLNV